ncbi:MAG TPA: sialidase family protein [Euzebyales bacterium]|nr:sialidase family protein [Euzebyales bacterium]
MEATNGDDTLANPAEQNGADRVAVHSRRQVLAGATYGLGATMVLGRPLLDLMPGGHDHAPKAMALRDRGADVTRLAGGGQPRSVCMGHGRMLVVGIGDDGEPVSWTRARGTRWSAHTLDRPAPGEPDVWGVATHRRRFVAVGSMLQRQVRDIVADRSVPGDQATVTFTAGRRVPTVWWTSDGVSWSGRMLDGVDEPHAQLISISCNSERLVAVGSTLDADGVQGDAALVLVSDDHGRTWRRGEIATADTSLAEGSLTGVVTSRGRWFATSSDMDGGALWASDDGLRWSSVASSARQFRGITLQGIGVRRGRFYVAGTTLADHRPRYFTSHDGGRSWHRLRPGPRTLTGDDVTVSDLTAATNGVVVVGTHGGKPVIEGGAADVGH